MNTDADLLVHRYLEGSLEGDEIREFNERVKNDPAFRSLLARMSYDAAVLRDLLMPAVPEVVAPAPRRSWGVLMPLSAAAAVLVGVVVLLFANRTPATGFLSGRIDSVNGRLIVREPAVYRFADGATAELERSTEAVLADHGFNLTRGGGRFHGSLRVGAPGMVVTGRDFRVEIRGESVVITGQVEIDRDGILTASTGELLLRPERRGKANRAWLAYDAMLSKSALTLDRAIAIAERGGGFPVHAELENDDRVVKFKVELTTRDVELDIADGRVLEDEPITRARPDTVLTLTQAIEIALKRIPGKAVEAEFDGGLIDVKIVAGDRLVSVEIDARTGAVVNMLVEDDEED